jgi:dienelactone hydrolase
LLEPDGEVRGNIIALPHDRRRPESLVVAPAADRDYAVKLARGGFRVLVPYLIDRDTDFSSLAGVRRTNLPHREFLYRMSFELGRHLIGYEVQKVLQAVSIFELEGGPPPTVVGYGQGGLTALYAAALDPRIPTTVVSGYFGPREALWQETIDRDVWGLLREMGDAEVASLIAPRRLIIDASPGPGEDGQPLAEQDVRANAAPGSLTPVDPADARREFERARPHYERLGAADAIQMTSGAASSVSEQALEALGVASETMPGDPSPWRILLSRQVPSARRQFDEIVAWNHKLVQESAAIRERFFSAGGELNPALWQAASSRLRRYFWEEVIGRMPDPDQALNPRTRLAYDQPAYRGYEVMLDVWEDVFAYGILLLPNDLAPGEKRPVVVFQHGLEGRPQDTVSGDSHFYHDISAKLAAEGFIVYAPQNPYIGRERFRQIQRKAHPLKLSLFSFIIGQHQQTLRWLKTLPGVDADRIGFYGLSYGGKTAMRVPAILEDYALSICSADFNQWVWKNTSTTDQYSYLFSGEYDMIEFNLANVANYAEMAMLIAPRPFMVERGHADGVAPDEWVAYEYAKVRRFYAAKLKLPERTRIEFFDGPHTINAKGTLEFLRQHLGPIRGR